MRLPLLALLLLVVLHEVTEVSNAVANHVLGNQWTKNTANISQGIISAQIRHHQSIHPSKC